MPYFEQHTQNSCGFPRMAVLYLEYPTRDRKATRVGRLHQIRLARMGPSLVPYMECATRNSHAVLSIACYSEPYSGQKPYLGRCTIIISLVSVKSFFFLRYKTHFVFLKMVLLSNHSFFEQDALILNDLSNIVPKK